MHEEKLYLRPNLVIEPLVDSWYAWSHLICPGTAAMNILERHLPLFESYLDDPDIHAQAVSNPKMRGGPFMDFGGGRLDEVNELKKETLRRQKLLLQFAAAVKELDRLLVSEAKGFGLQDFYNKIPSLLRGYVELFYDRNNNAGFRFFESLLYQSPYYNKSSQSIAIWLTNNDHRPFCLSTPRLKDQNVLHLGIPFDNIGIDELAKMKDVPQPLEYIKRILGVSKDQESLFETFFHKEPPRKYKKYTGDKIRMRYFGHACILIETSEISILIDPLISYYGYVSEVDHFSFEDLPDYIDYILITHNHQDHVLFETLLPLRHKVGRILVPLSNSGKLEDPDLKLMFENIGFDNVVSIREMEKISFSDVSIMGLPFIGEHSDLNILAKSCFLVEVSGFKLLFMADSRVVDSYLYRHVYNLIGDIDVMFLGMECDGAPLTWLYGPLMTMKISRDQAGSRRLAGSNCNEGLELINIFHPKEVYVYAMGQEPWLEFVSSVKYTDESNPIIQSNRLVEICRKKGITAERLFGEKELLYPKREAKL